MKQFSRVISLDLHWENKTYQLKASFRGVGMGRGKWRSLPPPRRAWYQAKKVTWFLVRCRFFLRFAISGKEEDWQEALSSGKSNVNVISVTSTKRKAQSSEEQIKTHKKHKKHKTKHKTGWTAYAGLYIKACFSSRPSELQEQKRKGFRTPPPPAPAESEYRPLRIIN